jgi:hypothetical protein
MDLNHLNPFLQIDEYKFQELCRDLLGKQQEDGIATCRTYEVRGAAQYGADVLANCNDGHSVDIGQCKRYSEFPASKISKASDEFLDHLDTYWKPRYTVRRFILMVACKLEKRDHHAEIQKQAKRFSSIGIGYEVWDHDTLRLKLAPHPDLVRYHFPRPIEPWVEVICGAMSSIYAVQPNVGSNSLTFNLVNEQVERIASLLSSQQAEKLESIRELNRRGRSREAYEQVCQMRQMEGWSILNNQLRAKIIKVMAALALGRNLDTKQARELVAEAIALDPNGNHTFIQALVAYYEDDLSTAQKVVQEPLNTDSFNLKVAFQLELNNAPEALRLIASPPMGITADTDTKRLRSLALLGTGKIEDALKEINTAVEERPEWENLKTVKAMIEYYSCLSPAALPKNSLSWPEPVNWQFIKRDSESLLRLCAAEKHFSTLIISDEKSADQKLLFETWRLACLANDAERQAEAVDFCKELLSENPGHPYGLAWAITRNFDVDYSRSRNALEQTQKQRLNGIDDIRIDGTLALMGIYLKQGETRKARQLLQSSKSEIQRIGADSLYTFWLGQIAVNEGKFDEALKIAQREKGVFVRRTLKTMALRAKYVQTGEWKPLARHLEKCLEKTQDGEYLIELCHLQIERKDWRFVAERCDQLIEMVGTADAVRLAVAALWNANRPAKCLQVLKENENKFPGAVLPEDLLRVRALCQTRTGALAEGVTDAEALVSQEASTQNIIALLDAQLQKADLRGFAFNARRILQRDDVDSESLLRIAKFVHLEDTELARKLWLRAKDDVLDKPELLNEALSLSYRLGLEREARPLFQQMQRYAEEGVGPFSSHHVREMIPRMKTGAKRQQKVNELYATGQLPLHLFAQESGFPLADVLHGLPEMSRKQIDLRRQSKVFTRHGGRILRENNTEAAPDWRLHMDVTALLLAADLEILDDVEKEFKPIYVSPALPKALLSQLEKLLSYQTSRIENHKVVLQALEANKFQLIPQDGFQHNGEIADFADLSNKLGESWVNLAVQARAESAYLIEHLPLTSRDEEMQPVVLPESIAANVVNCRTVLDSLYADGRLTDAGYEHSLSELGVEGNQVIENPPQLQPSAKLYLVGHIVEALASAHLLDQACRYFRVFADPEYVEQIKAEVDGYNRYQELAEWLKLIRERISAGFDDGTYKGIVVEDENMSESEELNPDFATVNALLRLKPKEGDVVWVDDRYTNGYSTISGAPIITITDVLAALRRKERLTEAEYYAKLLRLRSGNIRYLPLTKNEILFHLNQARVLNGNLIETEELSTLRRYTAACFLDSRMLQKPPMPGGSSNTLGELSFVLETTGAVADAIVDVWSDSEESPETLWAKPNWLMENLYTGRFGVRHLLPSGGEASDDGLYHIGLDIGEFLVKGVGVGNPFPQENEQTRRQQYFQWLNERIIDRRIKANPGAVAAAAKVLASIFSEHASQEYENTSARDVARRLLQKLFLDLPEPITDELKLDSNVMSWLGLTRGTFLSIGSHLFPSDKFWPAAEQVINGQVATITLDGSDEAFTLVKAQASSDESLAIEILDANGAPVSKLDTPLLGVLWRSRAKRLDWLRRNRFWFDCEQEIFEREIEEIASILDPRVRVDRANSWVEESAEVYYRGKEKKLHALKQIHWTDLTGLTADGLLRHYRLEPRYSEAANFADVLSVSTERLLIEEGLEATLNRVACLPVKIADSVVAELINLPVETRNELFERLALEWSSPVSKLHFLDLVLRCAPNDQKALDYAASVVEDLFSETRGAADFNLFAAVLNVVNQEISYWKAASEWSHQVRLALVWAHASRLFNLLHAEFGSADRLIRWLLDTSRHFTSEVFLRDLAYWNDCLHTHRLNRRIFLTHAVASLLASNDEAALNVLKLPDLVRRAAFKDEKENPILEHNLLRDPLLELNSTSSFFGGDRAETLARLIGIEDIAILASPHLEKLVYDGIQSLSQNPAYTLGWSAIEFVVGDLPLYKDLRQEFVSLIGDLDFESILQTDVHTARYALSVIAMQKELLTEQILARCREWLMRLTENLALENKAVSADQEDKSAQSAAFDLVQIALLLTLAEGKPRTSSEAFKELMYELLNRWGEMATIIEPTIMKLYLELPINQLQGIAELLLAVRAGQDME